MLTPADLHCDDLHLLPPRHQGPGHRQEDPALQGLLPALPRLRRPLLDGPDGLHLWLHRFHG